MRSKIKKHDKRLDMKFNNSNSDQFTPKLKIEVVNRGQEKIQKLGELLE
jgi:preprotein translocase subunit Sec63